MIKTIMIIMIMTNIITVMFIVRKDIKERLAARKAKNSKNNIIIENVEYTVSEII
jgi:hypothetical protein